MCLVSKDLNLKSLKALPTTLEGPHFKVDSQHGFMLELCGTVFPSWVSAQKPFHP